MPKLNLLKTALSGLIIASLGGCASSPLNESQNNNNAGKIRMAQNEGLVLSGEKAVLVFHIDRNSFRGSLPCRFGELEFENIISKKTVMINFTRMGYTGPNPAIVTLDPGTYIPKWGTCSFLENMNKSLTGYSSGNVFQISDDSQIPVVLNGGDVLFPGTYTFTQIEGPSFAMGFKIPRNDMRKTIERRRPNLADRYRNSYDLDGTSP